MKKHVSKIIVALTIAAIGYGATHIVSTTNRLTALETDRVWIKKALTEIKEYIKNNRNCR